MVQNRDFGPKKGVRGPKLFPVPVLFYSLGATGPKWGGVGGFLLRYCLERGVFFGPKVGF